MRIKNAGDLGQLIRKTRLAHGLRQIDLAHFSGCGERFIVELENGKPTCQLEKAINVAILLGISINARMPPPERAPEEGAEE